MRFNMAFDFEHGIKRICSDYMRDMNNRTAVS